MSTRRYRLTVIGSALSWLLLGLHLPTAHELMDHQANPPMSVLIATMILAALSAAGLWALLIAPASSRTP